VDRQLQTLIELQALDTRIAGLEAEAARLPQEIAAIRAAADDAQRALDDARGQLDSTRKDTRAKEKDLEVTQGKRVKSEARLYEVKTNIEYSAVLTEIETIKQEKATVEDEILTLMERQDRLAGEIKEAEARLKASLARCDTEEAALRAKLTEVEGQLAGARSHRSGVSRDVSPAVLGDYEKILRARGGLAIAPVMKPELCSGCRMLVRPQRLQELKQQNALIACESCGRYLYWPA
jgi:predicted  nucleic acid-binding Zn-ribbon protein